MKLIKKIHKFLEPEQYNHNIVCKSCKKENIIAKGYDYVYCNCGNKIFA